MTRSTQPNIRSTRKKKHATTSVGFCLQTPEPGMRVINLLIMNVTNVLLTLTSSVKINLDKICLRPFSWLTIPLLMQTNFPLQCCGRM